MNDDEGHDREFLTKNEAKIADWVNFVVKANRSVHEHRSVCVLVLPLSLKTLCFFANHVTSLHTHRAEGILSIINKSHVTDVNDPFHTINVAKRITCPTLLIGKSIGRYDRSSRILIFCRQRVLVSKQTPTRLYVHSSHPIPLGGKEDRVATPSEIHRLATEGLINIPPQPSSSSSPVMMLEKCGHNCCFEAPQRWRGAVLDFLS